jgi:hypothetical protein
LTFATKFRQPFLQGDVRDAVLESFRLIAREIRVEVLAAEAFSIMPTSSSVSPTTKSWRS